jgi:hypothetical protein
MFYILLFLILITLIITIAYNKLFSNKVKINNIEMFKNVGTSGIAITDITLLFGIVSLITDSGENKNIACYSYRDKVKKGERILITDYDLQRELYVIDQYPYI